MKHIKEILKENNKVITLYIISGLVIAFLTNYKAIYFQQVVDNFTNQSLSMKNIVIYGVILTSFYFMNYIDEYPAKKLENGIYLDFKLLALKKISKIPFIEYRKLGTGKLTQRVENGAQAGKQILFDYWLCVIRQLLPTILFSIWFIWKIDSRIAYFILVGYVVVFIVTNLLLKMLYKMKEKILYNEEMFNHYLVRGFMEMVVFRLNRRFPEEIRKATGAKSEIVNAKVKMNMIHEAFFTIFAFIVALLDLGVLVFAWKYQTISVGSVIALLSLIENAYTPIAIVNVLFVQYKLDKETYERFSEFLDVKDDEQLEQGEGAPSYRGEIAIKNLSFQYNQHSILQNLNMVIHPGEKIALVGSSGSGKTTFIELLLGLLKYDQGSIQIDGRELKEIKLNNFYGNVSYISQEAPIFDGTIKENLVYNQSSHWEEIYDALGKVELLDTVNKMDQGIDTVIGERGMTLSGGERQRLALARLWFQKNDIVILDEATSALDNITEEKVMNQVMKLLADKTVVAVAHRLSSVKEFDRILVFQNGEIVEQGTFAELLLQDSYFKELYHKNIYLSFE